MNSANLGVVCLKPGLSGYQVSKSQTTLDVDRDHNSMVCLAPSYLSNQPVEKVSYRASSRAE